MILPESVRPAARDWNRGHGVPTYRVETCRAADPDGAIARREHGSGIGRRDSIRSRRECHDTAVVETVQASRRRHPHVPFAIFEKPVHDIAREAVFAVEM